MKAMHSSKTQQGASTLEIMFVIIIAALILVFAAAKGFGLFSRQTNNVEQSNVAELVINVRALKSTQGYGASGANLVPQLIATKGIPSGLTMSGNVPYNSWAGAVTVVSGGISFTITYSSVPSDACVLLATKVAKNDSFSTRINAGSAINGEVTTAAAATACSSDNNTVSWIINA